ncbi:hypothetical protein [Streptomyces sp. 6-11-2]|uniref:hypothetical protein n=1 Tax=Streptomyces sp. 6-11-2 TaxID=2585753 RepID=UPI001170EA43|nr:hypothetical protein [Streptomyces sp. 6-11-2]GED88750.1 hypothetical protein TNCT6_58350 [Streptomyces sp. 6-11-2]
MASSYRARDAASSRVSKLRRPARVISSNGDLSQRGSDLKRDRPGEETTRGLDRGGEEQLEAHHRQRPDLGVDVGDDRGEPGERLLVGARGVDQGGGEVGVEAGGEEGEHAAAGVGGSAQDVGAEFRGTFLALPE